jgi:hypothetical protein
MEKNPRKTKAFIITFIAVLALLLLAYFLLFKGGGDSFTKSILDIQKSFSPLLTGSKNTNVNVATNGSGTNNATGTNGVGGGATGGINATGGSGSVNASSLGTGSSTGSVNATGGSGFGNATSGSGAGFTAGISGFGTTGGGIFGFIPECNDGIDNDNNGLKDNADPGCWKDRTNANTYDNSDQLELELRPECNDGIDNDKKNGKDSLDPGCWKDRTNASTYDPNDQLELDLGAGGAGGKPQCSDGLDNDKNGLSDANDPGCWKDRTKSTTYDVNDQLELDFKPQCDDDKDNDGNGLKDQADPGCWKDRTKSTTYDVNDQLELDVTVSIGGGGSGTGGYSPQCSDNIDNDENGLKDSQDPGCWKDSTDPNTYDATDPFEYDLSSHGYIDACTLTLMKAQLLSNQAEIDKLEAAAITAYNNSFVIKAGTRGVWPLVKKGGGATGPIGGGVSTVTECSDGADNDNNGLKDKSDASCHTDGDKYNISSYSKTIAKEINLPVPPPLPIPDCSDNIDNDKNGQKDSQDPGCWSNMLDSKTYQPNDNYEAVEILECNDGIDNDGNGVKDSKDPACWTNQKDPSTYNPSSPYENLVGSFTLPHIPYTKTTVTVQTKNGTLIIPVILLGIYPGNIIPATPAQISAYLNTMGYDKQAVDSTGKACIPTILPQCSDNKDNDGDGLKDRSDPGCHPGGDPVKPWDQNDNSEYNQIIPPPYVAACKDGVDNDGDNLADEDDPGCHSDLNPYVVISYTPDKTSELNFIPECRDGKDNDADNLKDQNDPGCHSDLNPNNNGQDANHPNTYLPNKPTEFNIIPECSDGIDNDKNGVKDDKDPGCYTDLKITKKADGTIDTTKYNPNKILELKILAQCSDGIDNDKKNDKDEKDFGCWVDKNDPATYNPEDNLELDFSDGLPVPECNDGLDNDGDTFIDKEDSSCHSDGDKNNTATYNPKGLSETTFGATRTTPPPDPVANIASCVDVPLTFTTEEQRKLDELKRQFALLAPKIKTDADVVTENDQRESFIELTANVNELYNQCVNQTGVTYNGPREKLSNPYYQDQNQTSISYVPNESSNIDGGTYLGEWNHWTKLLSDHDSQYGNFYGPDCARRLSNGTIYNPCEKNPYQYHLNRGDSNTAVVMVNPRPNNWWYNKPRYGLYQIKNIIDRAVKDYKNQTGPAEHKAGYLTADDVGWNWTTLKNSLPTDLQCAPNSNPDTCGLYNGPDNIYQNAKMYLGASSTKSYLYFCDFDNGNPDDMLEHNSAGNLDTMIVCPMLRGFVSIVENTNPYGATTDLQKIHVEILKRMIDDKVMKVWNGDPTSTAAIYAYPLYEFEQMLKIW